MKTKVILFIITALVLTLIGALSITSASKQEKSSSSSNVRESSLTIKERVERAKASGVKQISLNESSRCFAEVASLEDALTRLNVVIAEPIERLSYTTQSQNIGTWYKFKIIQTLSKQTQLPNCPLCKTSGTPPAELLPVNADEVLVPQVGGDVVIDGIKVTQRPMLPAIFSMNFLPQELPADKASTVDGTFKYHESISTSRRYLLFLLPAADEKAVSFLDIGPAGVFNISSDNVLEPIDNNASILSVAIERLFNNSLERLTLHLKKQRQSQ